MATFFLYRSGNGDAYIRGVTCLCTQRGGFKDEAGKESVRDADKFYLPQLLMIEVGSYFMGYRTAQVHSRQTMLLQESLSTRGLQNQIPYK